MHNLYEGVLIVVRCRTHNEKRVAVRNNTVRISSRLAFSELIFGLYNTAPFAFILIFRSHCKFAGHCKLVAGVL